LPAEKIQSIICAGIADRLQRKYIQKRIGKMEILLTVILLSSLLTLGLLIASGNERQRKAIDRLRAQAESWAEQDIKIKREKLAREIDVPDARAWLESIATAALGRPQKLVSLAAWQQGDLFALVADCQDGRRLVFSPVPRNILLSAVEKKKSVLAGVGDRLLGGKPAKASFYELSVVNGGMFFDIEANKVWQEVVGYPLPGGRLGMYEVEG
jgi:hypothetical protein